MRISILPVLALLSGCTLPAKEAEHMLVSSPSADMKHRSDLLDGKVDVALFSALERVSPGARISVSITLTNRGDSPVWIPYAFANFFELRGRGPGAKVETRLDGGRPNDLVYARKLERGEAISEPVGFEIPKSAGGTWEIFIWNHPSPSSRLRIEVR
jgi:hypothetical protein